MTNHTQRVVLACAAALLALHVGRNAWATCSYSCSLALVDAGCQALDAAGPIAGDAVKVTVDCDETCCGGGVSCTTTPVAVTAADVQLFGSDNGSLPHAFSAHPSCASVFVLDACLADGSYRVGFQTSYDGMNFVVSGDVCPKTPADAGTDGSSGAGGVAGTSGAAGGTGLAGTAASSASDDGSCAIGRSRDGTAWALIALVGTLALAFRRR